MPFFLGRGCCWPPRALQRRVIAAAVPLVIIHSREQVRRRKGRGVGRVLPLLRSPRRVLRVFGRTAGLVRAVARLARSGGLGSGLRGVSDAEQPGGGCGLRERGGVEEGGVGGGGEEERRRDGGGRGSMTRGDGGGSGGGEGEEALRSERHFPEMGRGRLK